MPGAGRGGGLGRYGPEREGEREWRALTAVLKRHPFATDGCMRFTRSEKRGGVLNFDYPYGKENEKQLQRRGKMMKKTLIFALSMMILLFSACETKQVDNKEQTGGNGEPQEQVQSTKQEETKGASQEKPKETSSEVLPMEVKEFGYSVNGNYLYYSAILHNPNTDKAIKYPKFRVVARDAEGILLGSKDQTISVIYPGQDFVYASQAFEAEEKPTTVNIEVVEPDEHNITSVSALEHEKYEPLVAVNTAFRTDRVVGEIQNNNDYDIDTGVVSVVFRDAEGNLIGGTSTFVDSLKANTTTPFDTAIYFDFATENFEVYANIW